MATFYYVNLFSFTILICEETMTKPASSGLFIFATNLVHMNIAYIHTVTVTFS